MKFKQLYQVTENDDDNNMKNAVVQIVDKKAYSEVLAPIYCLNDFSTEFLNRQTGDKITGSKL